MANANTLKLVSTEGEEIHIDYESMSPLVPDKTYQAIFTHYETVFIFRTFKIFLHFTIVEPGEHYGKKIYRAYPVKQLIGKLGKNGKFRLKTRSELYLMLCRVLHLKKRIDRISLRPLKNVVLLIKTRTVTKDYRQRNLPEFLRYSVVDEILEVHSGSIET